MQSLHNTPARACYSGPPCTMVLADCHWPRASTARACQLREVAARRCQALQIMNGTMRVDIRQDCLHAARLRRKAAETQQRIEPYDAVREATQASCSVSLSSYCRSLRDRGQSVTSSTPWLWPVSTRRCPAVRLNLGERRPPMRVSRHPTSRPPDLPAISRNRDIGIALAQRTRCIGEARAEQKYLQALARLQQRVAEVQHRARITARSSSRRYRAARRAAVLFPPPRDSSTPSSRRPRAPRAGRSAARRSAYACRMRRGLQPARRFVVCERQALAANQMPQRKRPNFRRR